MKINCSLSPVRRRLQAMTLAEMMTSVAIFTMLFGGLLTVSLFGMRQDELTNSKLGANDQSRQNFNLILDEIRASKDIQIGKGTYSNFVPITNGIQSGSSMQIIPSTNLNQYVYYWFDTNAGCLYRAGVSNSVVSVNVVASYLTNQTSQWITNAMCFRAMDYTGTTNLTVDPVLQTNANFNYVVNILMQFSQYQYPLTLVGSNYLYNYYQLTYSATRRSP